MIGRTLGSYRITAQVGTGGMGIVYAAEHVAIGRKAAIKVLLPKYSGNAEVVNRFFNEAKAAARIEHRGIVDVYDYGHTDDDVAYIIMEFLDGETLGARMRRLRRLSDDDVTRITRQIAVALAAAHDAGIVHRDLKPDNVFLVPDGEVIGGERVKLLDFGIAKLMGMSDSLSKTKTGVVMGSPLYMSPEQCRGAGEADFRSDIYALGCVMYHIACARPPFPGKGGGEILAKHIYEMPVPPRSFLPEMSVGLEAIILRSLAKEPDDRFPDMRTMIAALDASGGGRFRSSTEVVPYDVSLADARSVTDISQPSIAEQRPMATTLGVAASQVSILSGQPQPRRRGRLGLIVGIPVAVVAAVVVALAAGAFEGDPAAVSAGPAAARDAAMEESSVDGGGRRAALVPAQDAAAPGDQDQGERATADAGVGVDAGSPPPVQTFESQDASASDQIRLAIVSRPPGAQVRDGDGRVIGRTPIRTRIPRDQKRHVFTLVKPGYEDESLVVIATRDRSFRPRMRRVRDSAKSRATKPRDDKPRDDKPRDDKPRGDKPPDKPDDGFGKTVDPFQSKGGSND